MDLCIVNIYTQFPLVFQVFVDSFIYSRCLLRTKQNGRRDSRTVLSQSDVLGAGGLEEEVVGDDYRAKAMFHKERVRKHSSRRIRMSKALKVRKLSKA